MLRNRVTWSQELCESLRATAGFQIVTEPVLSLFTFRYAPAGATDLDALNQRLVDALNDDGRIYITQTRTQGALVIRFQAGQFDATRADVRLAYDAITEIAATL